MSHHNSFLKGFLVRNGLLALLIFLPFHKHNKETYTTVFSSSALRYFYCHQYHTLSCWSQTTHKQMIIPDNSGYSGFILFRRPVRTSAFTLTHCCDCASLQFICTLDDLKIGVFQSVSPAAPCLFHNRYQEMKPKCVAKERTDHSCCIAASMWCYIFSEGACQANV